MSDYTTAFKIPFNHPTPTGVLIYNNTGKPIPIEFIKTSYFDNLYDSNGALIYWDPNRYFNHKNIANSINYKKVDLKQDVRTYILIELISGKILKTTHDREVIVE